MIHKGPVWAIVSFIVVFLAGVCSGIVLDRTILSKHRGQDRRGGPPLMERMTKELGLTAEQQAGIQDVFRRSDERFKELHREMHKNLDVIRGQIKTEIDAILTADQIKKMDALIREQTARKQGLSRTSERRESSSRDNQPPRPREN